MSADIVNESVRRTTIELEFRNELSKLKSKWNQISKKYDKWIKDGRPLIVKFDKDKDNENNI